jgi:hypothetical protein
MSDAIRDKVPIEELISEQAEIESTYLSLRFAQKIRQTSLACFKQCGGKVQFPFRVDQSALVGKADPCFSDCLNVNFEKGPFLNELGAVPEDAIPKKFIWAHGI